MRDFARPVAIVSSASFETPSEPARNEVEMLLPVIDKAMADAGLTQRDIGFTVSGSSDYLQGFPFAFVGALDAVGAWPPIRESHLEMDGAFALAEAVAVLQDEHIDTALVYAFARPSRGELDRTLALQLDPYTVAPLNPDARGLAGLQAQAMRDSGRFPDIADVPPTYVADGATVVVLAAGDRARELTATPAWITGLDHRIEAPALGVRDLTVSASAALAGERAGADGVEAAWLHTPYPHQELLLREALGLADKPVHCAAGPMMVGGLERFAAASKAIASGEVTKALAHATSGPCLQQNLVGILEGGR
ncbi:MAG TPA: lipid-transfer protein [Mycobacteriales bacterium]|nr:lipid-transfer protein [Mycobacteriales bacterium]HWA66977.1 lipid-transfer protein [Mycobacteriales bacterium]